MRRWFAKIVATFRKPIQYFVPAPSLPAPSLPAPSLPAPSRFESNIAAQSGKENALPDAPVPTSTDATPSTAAATSVHPQIAEAASVQAVPTALDRQEVQRRRELVRALFNDFWTGRDDKPATFQERLDQAEPYLNERLIKSGECWQLNADSRKALALPSRPNARARK
jgi:hypothetical protein